MGPSNTSVSRSRNVLFGCTMSQFLTCVFTTAGYWAASGITSKVPLGSGTACTAGHCGGQARQAARAWEAQGSGLQ